MLKNLDWDKKKNIKIYMALTIAMFIIFYPHLSGLPVNKEYINIIKFSCFGGVLWIAYLLNVVLKMVL